MVHELYFDNMTGDILIRLFFFLKIIDWRHINTFLESDTIIITVKDVCKMLELKSDQVFIMQLMFVVLLHILFC